METERTISTIKLMNQALLRLDHFDGSNFIIYILDPDLPPLLEPTDEDTDEVKAARKQREDDELIYRGHILNALSSRLYDLYTNTKSAKEIWTALEFEYKAEEEVGAIITKLPSTWKGYRKRFLHRSEDYSLEDIQKYLRIKEESRSRDKPEETNFRKIKGWWYDTCATFYVSYDKSIFKTFDELRSTQEIQMGNENRSKVLGKGSIDLLFTSRKTITLTNVLYVSNMNQNLVSGALLGKPGIKTVYDSENLILSKSEENRENVIRKISIIFQIEDDCKTYKEAMSSRDSAFWKEAINDEIDSTMSNHT
ncbi:hypothetical protein UlMin_010950 [Ulmus minor]